LFRVLKHSLSSIFGRLLNYRDNGESPWKPRFKTKEAEQQQKQKQEMNKTSTSVATNHGGNRFHSFRPGKFINKETNNKTSNNNYYLGNIRIQRCYIDI